MASFANFYVGQNEITKQFKGCFKMEAPFSSVVGTLGGLKIQTGIKDIIPIAHTSTPGLWLFSGIDGNYVKMVGINYKTASGPPQRVDGRAFAFSGTAPTLTAQTVSNYWNNASQKGIKDGDYSLSFSNNAPLNSVNTCLQNATAGGGNEFGIYNVDATGAGRCLNEKDMTGSSALLVDNVSEAQCMGFPEHHYTAYSIQGSAEAKNTLGKTFMGAKDKNGKMSFHAYPDALLKSGKQYTKYSGYSAIGNDLTDGTINGTTSAECEQICINKGDNCNGFDFDTSNNTCQLKHKIYPNGPRQEDKSHDIYTRMPAVKNDNSCPKDIKAVGTNFITNSGSISESPMSLDFQCETEGDATQNVHGIEQAYTMLTKDLGALRKNNDAIIKEFGDVKRKIKSSSDEYHTTIQKMGDKGRNTTLDQFLLDNQKRGKILTIKNVALGSALIILSILIVRVLRK